MIGTEECRVRQSPPGTTLSVQREKVFEKSSSGPLGLFPLSLLYMFRDEALFASAGVPLCRPPTPSPEPSASTAQKAAPGPTLPTPLPDSPSYADRTPRSRQIGEECTADDSGAGVRQVVNTRHRHTLFFPSLL